MVRCGQMFEDKVHRLPLCTFDSGNVGEVLDRVTNDMTTFRGRVVDDDKPLLTSMADRWWRCW